MASDSFGYGWFTADVTAHTYTVALGASPTKALASTAAVGKGNRTDFCSNGSSQGRAHGDGEEGEGYSARVGAGIENKAKAGINAKIASKRAEIENADEGHLVSPCRRAHTVDLAQAEQCALGTKKGSQVTPAGGA